MNWIRAALAWVLRWALADEIGRYEADGLAIAAMRAERLRHDQAMAALRTEVRSARTRLYALEPLRDQLAALQALDVDFHATGKLIICAQIGGRDLVKIIAIPRRATLAEHREMVQTIESRYGARLGYVDAPSGFDAQLLRNYPGAR